MQHSWQDIITVTELDGTTNTYCVLSPFDSDVLYQLWAQQVGAQLSPNTVNPRIYSVAGQLFGAWLVSRSLIRRINVAVLEVGSPKVAVYK